MLQFFKTKPFTIRFSKSRKRSFTLVELLTVIAVVGLVSVIVALMVNPAIVKARDGRRTMNLKALTLALELYLSDYGFYPIVVDSNNISSNQGLCLEQSTQFSAEMLTYMLNIPHDPKYVNIAYPEYCYWYRTTANGSQYKISARVESSSYTPASQDGGTESNSYEVFGGQNANLLSRGYILVSKSSNNAYYFDRTGSILNNKTAFYVMQYEAKYDTDGDSVGNDAGTGVPPNGCRVGASYDTWDWGNTNSPCPSWSASNVVSSPEGSPIAGITHTEALTACPTGFHLITNDEWMAIARDAEQVASNWGGNTGEDGTVGSTVVSASPCNQLNNTTCKGGLKRGNNGTNDSAGYNGADPEKGSGRNAKAKLTLSNNQTIWDIAGNVWEHVKNTGVTGNDTLISLQDNSEATADGSTPITDTGFNWSDFATGGGLARWTILTQASYYGDLDNDGDSDNDDKAFLRPSNDSWKATQGMGRLYHYSNSSNATDSYVFVRGGNWYNGASAGAFTLNLS